MHKKALIDIENPWALFSVLAAIIIFWLLCSAYFMNIHAENPENAARLGDTYGIINSLFSGLAFAGLFYTILLQKKELRETKEEFIQQNRTMSVQRFENTFFNLMSLHNKILDEMRGREFFHSLVDRLDHLKVIHYNSHIDFAKLETAYNLIVSSQEDTINLYLGSIHRIIKYIRDTEAITVEDKYFYEGILKSNLSDIERTFIFYHVSLSRKSRNIIDLLLQEDGHRGFIRLLNPHFIHHSHCILISILHQSGIKEAARSDFNRQRMES